MLKMIVVMDKNRLISKDGKIPWNIKEDREFFKRQTLGKTVVMGSDTYRSMNYEPLENRKNILLSNSIFDQKTTMFRDSTKLKEFIDKNRNVEDFFIIGGQSIYSLFMFYCDEIIITNIEKDHGKYGKNKYFPSIPKIFYLHEKYFLCKYHEVNCNVEIYRRKK